MCRNGFDNELLTKIIIHEALYSIGSLELFKKALICS